MRKIIGVAAVLACCGSAYGDFSWNEVGDAGQNNIGAAQTPFGDGFLTSIVGTIGGANDVDLFGPFVISDPVGFLADVRGGATFDTQLFLFDAAGFGVVHNDDESGPQSAIGGQAGFGVGEYYLAISAFNADPRDAGGGDIFGFAQFAGPLLQQRMPIGGAGALDAWVNSTTTTGGYTIAMQGVEPIPAPGAAMLALLGLGSVAAIRRRLGLQARVTR